MPPRPKLARYDAVVIGGGHNGLVAATYLGKSGMSVLLLERLENTGGAASSEELFAGVPAKINRYAHLVGLFPDRIVEELQLDMQLRTRRYSAYAPVVRNHTCTGLLVERGDGEVTRQSFRDLTGSDREYDAWRSFYAELSDFAGKVAPTLMEPLAYATEIYDRVKRETWEMLVERPISATLEARFADDTVRGVVAADALAGTFSALDDQSLQQNKAFLYHAIGGAQEKRVPVGGMGAVTAALERAAWRNGVEIVTGAFVDQLDTDGRSGSVSWQSDGESHSVDCDWVLGNVAPWVLQMMLGQDPGPRPEGTHMQVNMLLERLPKLRSDIPPAKAFAGTVHITAGYQQILDAHEDAVRGQLPSEIPGSLLCHTLTDPSILGPLAMQGMHSFSFYGMQTPARLFADDVERTRDEAVVRVLDAINEHLEEPIESLLALDSTGIPCLEAMAPQDIENALAMPGGHVFHGDLAWPWAHQRSLLETPAHRWGVQTSVPNVVICGAGAQRGGTVSGIGGHNAAMAVLDTRDGRL